VAGDVEIRPAVPRDGAAFLAAAAQIDRETEFLGVPGQPHPWAERPEAELRSLAENGRGAVLLALAGGEIVGYLSAFTGHFTRTRGSVFIAVVGLRESWRGRGIGTRLFEAIEAWARGQRAWRLELRVSALNGRGQALYRKQGFAIEGRIRGGVLRNDEWTDDFWMGKLLEPLPGDPPAVEQYVDFAPRTQLPAGGEPRLRPMQIGDGAGFRAWDMRMSETMPFAIKQPGECASAEAIERDIAATPADPRFWLAATARRPGGGERIVGFASGNIEFGFRMQHDAFVNIAVLPDWCGRGLGRRMHDAVAAWAEGHRVRRLTAAIQAPNQAGRAFAAALGYDEEVTMRCDTLIGGRMVDRLRLGKMLPLVD
jgi:RimJ/RimL family protein N-acetyltransferase